MYQKSGISDADIAIEAYKLLCAEVGTEYSLHALKLAIAGDFKSISDLKIVPGEYSNSTAFARDYLVYSYLRKYKGFPILNDLRAKAILDFGTIEEQNALTNKRIRSMTLSKGAQKRAFARSA